MVNSMTARCPGVLQSQGVVVAGKPKAKPKSPPFHHPPLQLEGRVCADMSCLVFIKHGAVHYGQASPLWSHLS